MARARTTAKNNSYLAHPVVDLLTAGGGLSILLLPVLFFLSGPERPPGMIQTAVLASFIVNYPHFAATLYRLYHNAENRSAYPWTAYLAPFIFGILFAAALKFPESLGSYYCKIFLIWSGYHYSGQTLGISLIYAKRSNFPVGIVERGIWTAAIYSSYLLPIIRAETRSSLQPFFGIPIPAFQLPAFFTVWAWGFLAVSWAAFLTYLLLSPRYHRGRWAPPGVWLPPLAQFCWFIPGSYSPFFYEFVPLFHGLQYLLIVWVFRLKEQTKTYDRTKAQLAGAALWFDNLKYGILLVAIGALLFRWIPDGLVWGFGIAPNIAEPLWIATVQLHHFWTDGRIWRLRNPQVGEKLLTRPCARMSRPGGESAFPAKLAPKLSIPPIAA